MLFKMMIIRPNWSICLLTLMFFLACGKVGAAPQLMLEGDDELGEVYQFSTTEAVIQATNLSDQPIEIQGVDQSDRSGIRILDKQPVLVRPRSTQTIKVAVNPSNRIGTVHLDAQLLTAPALSKPAIVTFNAFVESILEEGRAIVDFGVVDSGTEHIETFRLVSDRDADLRATQVDEVGEGFAARIVDEGRAIEIRVRSDVGWGTHLEYVKVHLNSALQPELWVRLMADVHGAIVPSINPVDFSVVRQGSGAEEAVMLERKSDANVEIEEVQVEGAQLSSSVSACPQRKGCAVVKFRLGNEQPSGQIYAKARVRFRNESEVLPIGIRGLVLGKDQRVIDLTARLKDNVTTAAPTRISEELKSATAADPAASVAPSGAGPLLKWTVANEAGIYGYGIYRGTSKEGPLLRVNRNIVRVGDTNVGKSSNYQWRDNSAHTGVVYWYYVGMIYNDGRKERLTPLAEVTAK